MRHWKALVIGLVSAAVVVGGAVAGLEEIGAFDAQTAVTFVNDSAHTVGLVCVSNNIDALAPGGRATLPFAAGKEETCQVADPDPASDSDFGCLIVHPKSSDARLTIRVSSLRTADEMPFCPA
ncbi:hypothetical protein [Frondihabitans cladoniiphilus]|uniref:Subtilisin inhibitor-like n=1 Tax=Frondihabitans cladoniiphilus TaxID=715785 RepID=A0ABP8VNX9_9MICO